MTICNDGHEEICFEGYSCPLCETIKAMQQVEHTVNELDDLLNDAKLERMSNAKVISDLTNQLHNVEMELRTTYYQIDLLTKRVNELEHE